MPNNSYFRQIIYLKVTSIKKGFNKYKKKNLSDTQFFSTYSVTKMIRKNQLILGILATAAIASHFVPIFVKPQKDDVLLNPKTLEWKK